MKRLVLLLLLAALAAPAGELLRVENSLDAMGRLDIFKMVVFSFKNFAIAGIYIVAMIILALHLFHGVQSFVQTFGLNSDKSLPLVEKYGKVAAPILYVGYVSIPLVILLGIMNYKG